MIIYPCKQYNPATGEEHYINPTPFILEDRDLGIIHDTSDPATGEEIPAADIYDFMRKSAIVGRRIDKGMVNSCPEIEEMSVSYTYRDESGKVRHDIHKENVIRACNHFIGILNSLLNRYRGESFALIKGKEGWALDCDICQGIATPFIYDAELARSTENEIEKRAIRLAKEMIKNGTIQ